MPNLRCNPKKALFFEKSSLFSFGTITFLEKQWKKVECVIWSPINYIKSNLKQFYKFKLFAVF